MNSEISQRTNCCDWSRDSLMHKYVLLCVICGALSSMVGSILIIIYVLMRSNTSSLQYFETIPTYIPAILLISNGLIVMCFAKSKARFSYLIKIIGGFYLICALLCVVMTVTTTILHMNRLQTHHECVYTQRIRSCTCISAIVPNGDSSTHQNNEFVNHSIANIVLITCMTAYPYIYDIVGHHFTFEDIPNCEAVHGILFACLRALFGLSVFAILICIFSLMLVYQLLSHQKKKKYLQQLELRRRFHPQNRGLASHLLHPSYVSSHVSPHHLAHNRIHSSRHTQHCNCSDDALHNGWSFTPHTYDFLDYRSYYRNFEDDSQSNLGNMGNRAHSWTHWLNWSRNHLSANETSHQNINRNTNRGLLNYILRRNYNNNERGRESNEVNPNTIRWRSLNPHNYLPPHVFIPRIGSGGLSTLPMHFSRYPDNNSHNLRANLLSSLRSAHRRTRSNDGIFNHLNIGFTHNSPIDQISCPTSATNGSPAVFALWGPPPPYTCSQPQSLNRLNTISNNMNQRTVAQHCRESSIQSSDTNQASKLSTPVSERRMRCNAFSSQGIRLTIEGNDSSLTPKSKTSCIVEIHVPYNEDQHHNEIHEIEELKDCQKKLNSSFNTMPNIKRNEQILQQINHFKSLSNIPIIFPNKLKSTLIDSEFKLNEPKLEGIRNVYFTQISSPRCSLSSSTPNTTSDTTTEITSELLTENTESSTSATSFPVDPPTDYKSTLIIQTPNTHSSPITDKSSNIAERQVISGLRVKDSKLNNTQSMPNLSCIIPVPTSKSSTSTRAQPHFWDLHRIPSSGNTSTSQDFADFEFELDEEPLKFVADLPEDSLKTQSASDSIGLNKSSSETSSVTPEFIKPPTPFSNQNNYSTTSTATLSLSDPKRDIIINIKSIQV